MTTEQGSTPDKFAGPRVYRNSAGFVTHISSYIKRGTVEAFRVTPTPLESDADAIARADIIHRAVNSHKALVNALQRTRQMLENDKIGLRGLYREETINSVFDQADDALRLAGGDV